MLSNFLKKQGFKRRKVGSIPAKANLETQKEFLEKTLVPLLEEANNGQREAYFVDAAHFVLKPFLGFLWSFSRVFIKAPAGRKRFNVLGAINAVDHKLITVCNDEYINAASVCELLRKISLSKSEKPVTLVMDNARYQKCKLVWELADSLGIDLLYLPSYSPNLNLIERLWKFVKKEVLNSKYFEEFTAFKITISSCLAQTHTTYKEELDSLLRAKFQMFETEKIMCL